MLAESLHTVEAIVRDDPSNYGVGRQQIDLCIRLAARYSELEDSVGAQRYLRRGIEVGETMGISDEAVESLLGRARRQLKQVLQSEWRAMLDVPQH